MRPHTCYLVCCTPRSGSTLLCELLAGTGLAGRPEEYFAQRKPVTFGVPVWKTWDKADMLGYLDRIMELGTTENGVFASKIMWDHFHDMLQRLRSLPQFSGKSDREVLESVFPNLRLIWLSRRNKVRQAISEQKAVQTAEWFRPHGEKSGRDFRPQYHFGMIDLAVQLWVMHDAHWADFFAAAGIQPCTVLYEDLALDPDGTAHRVLEYIGIEVPPETRLAPPPLQKQADSLSEEWLRRYYHDKQQQRSRKFGLALARMLLSWNMVRGYITPALARRLERRGGPVVIQRVLERL